MEGMAVMPITASQARKRLFPATCNSPGKSRLCRHGTGITILAARYHY
jgi:hypothetical protein